jgi:curli biogenesis system outer membrane secretion channel CsgG
MRLYRGDVRSPKLSHPSLSTGGFMTTSIRAIAATSAVLILVSACGARSGAPPVPDPVRTTVDLASFVSPRAERPTIMVLDFDYSAVVADLTPEQGEGLGDLIRAVRGQGVGDQQRSESNIGAGIAQMAINGLLETGQFRVMERRALDQILGEQALATSDAAGADQRNVVRQAQILGAQYLLTGAITQMGFEETRRGLGVGGLGVPGVGAVGRRDNKTRVAMTARLVDTSTGEIVLAVTGEGISTLGGGFALGGAGRAGGLGFGSSQSNVMETAIGEATDMAVHNMLVNFATRWSNER